MNSKKEAIVWDQMKKSVSAWTALSNKASKQEIKKVIGLFQSVIRLDSKNEVVIAYKKNLLPKGMGVKHLAILLVFGLYGRLKNIKMKKKYLEMENLYMRKLQRKFNHA